MNRHSSTGPHPSSRDIDSANTDSRTGKRQHLPEDLVGVPPVGVRENASSTRVPRRLYWKSPALTPEFG